jgi:uncharacterized membrane protein YozB (DUF420 family)
MKKYARDILHGILIIVLITVAELLATLPFGAPKDGLRATLSAYMNLEFLLTAIPAGLITFLMARHLKTENKRQALKRAILWTAMVFFNYLWIGVLNLNADLIFTTIGIYALLLCVFIGPLGFALYAHLD